MENKKIQCNDLLNMGSFGGLNIIDDDDNNKRPQNTSCLTNNSIFY